MIETKINEMRVVIKIAIKIAVIATETGIARIESEIATKMVVCVIEIKIRIEEIAMVIVTEIAGEMNVVEMVIVVWRTIVVGMIVDEMTIDGTKIDGMIAEEVVVEAGTAGATIDPMMTDVVDPETEVVTDQCPHQRMFSWMFKSFTWSVQ